MMFIQKSCVSFSKSVVLIFFAAMVVGGCGKGEKSADENEKRTEKKKKIIVEKTGTADEKPVAPDPEKGAEKEKGEEKSEKEPASESGTPETAKTETEQEEDSEKSDKARLLYEEVLAFKDKGQYKKALNKANELMAGMPDSQEARDVIPVFRDIKKNIVVKRTCNVNYEMLMDDESVRRQYAAQKFFVKNPEVAEIYLLEKLRNEKSDKFKRVLQVLGKIKGKKTGRLLAGYLAKNSRPDQEKEILEVLSAYDDHTLVSFFSEELKSREDVRSLMKRINQKPFTLLMADVYVHLPDVSESAIPEIIQNVSGKKGRELFRDLAILDRLMDEYYEACFSKYISQLRKKNNTKAVTGFKTMQQYIIKQALADRQLKEALLALKTTFTAVFRDDFSIDTTGTYKQSSTDKNKPENQCQWNQNRQCLIIKTGDDDGLHLKKEGLFLPESGYARIEMVMLRDYPSANNQSLRVSDAEGNFYQFSWMGSAYKKQGILKHVDGKNTDTSLQRGTLDKTGKKHVIEMWWAPDALRLDINGIKRRQIRTKNKTAITPEIIELRNVQVDLELHLIEIRMK